MRTVRNNCDNLGKSNYSLIFIIVETLIQHEGNQDGNTHFGVHKGFKFSKSVLNLYRNSDVEGEQIRGMLPVV